MSDDATSGRPPLAQVVHVMSAYRKHGAALAVGGVTSAARAIAGIDPGHRLVVVPDGDKLDRALVGRALDSGEPLFHLHHALAFEALPVKARFIKTLHVLQRRQSRLRHALEVTRSEALQVEVLRRAARVTVATEACRAMLLEDHPELADLAERVVVLPLVPPEPIARPITRRSRPRVVALGRFDKLKGTETLIDVVGLLLRSHLDLEVVVAGGLPDHGKYERRWLEAFHRAIPDTHRERFRFVGWLAEGAVANLLATSDLMLAPSRLETCGLAVMEAMAAGCVVVASDIPAHREVLGKAGLFADDAAAMVEAVLSTLASPATLEDLAALGRTLLPDRAAVRAQWLHFWEQTR